MAVQIKKKPNENMYSLLRRFQEVYRKSRVAVLAKKHMYYQKPANKYKLKKEALRRRQIREKRQYLIRIGKINDDNLTGYGGLISKKK